MSDKEALKIFSRQPVSLDMINFLVATTNSIIQVRQPASQKTKCFGSSSIITKNPTISLANFIKTLINYSNVQTPTLMATLVYLNKLRNYLPANAIGMETTRHRIFLSALIVAAKSLNDSSPLNKHWTKYTDGLLSIEEVNLAERELISILNWDINIKEHELIITLQPFLSGIKKHLVQKQEWESLQRLNFYRLQQQQQQSTLSSSPYLSPPVHPNRSRKLHVSPSASVASSLNSSPSYYSLHNSSTSTSSKSMSSNSINSNLSMSNSVSTNSIQSIEYQHQQYNDAHLQVKKPSRIPLSSRSLNNLNQEPLLQNKQYVAAPPVIKKKRSMMSLLSSLS
ncbi:PHO85 interacting cyclin [Lodderomyces elongisporus]|uniref:PHO85 interacting cyclin n=1 Tax=Lodderomyces elongisporus TaxID=36914 RepID=UPI00291E73E4|nr:PHO85 interacting cyclin [Lodderomyces elongisporus]WLF76971.1 PHO85 interacting cyclin [Lodderomyces elongisporus]